MNKCALMVRKANTAIPSQHFPLLHDGQITKNPDDIKMMGCQRFLVGSQSARTKQNLINDEIVALIPKHCGKFWHGGKEFITFREYLHLHGGTLGVFPGKAFKIPLLPCPHHVDKAIHTKGQPKVMTSMLDCLSYGAFAAAATAVE